MSSLITIGIKLKATHYNTTTPESCLPQRIFPNSPKPSGSNAKSLRTHLGERMRSTGREPACLLGTSVSKVRKLEACKRQAVKRSLAAGILGALSSWNTGCIGGGVSACTLPLVAVLETDGYTPRNPRKRKQPHEMFFRNSQHAKGVVSPGNNGGQRKAQHSRVSNI